jgi:hypothetical protein
VGMAQRWAALGTMGRVAAILTAVVLIALLMPWYGVSIGSYSISVDGFHSFGLLTALGVVSVVAGIVRNDASWARSARLVGTILETAGAALFLASYHTAYSTNVLSVSFGPQIGVYLALAAGAAGLVVGLNERRRTA